MRLREYIHRAHALHICDRYSPVHPAAPMTPGSAVVMQLFRHSPPRGRVPLSTLRTMISVGHAAGLPVPEPVVPPSDRPAAAARGSIPVLRVMPEQPHLPPPEEQRPADVEEVELMDRVRWGDVAAFERVVEKFWKRTFHYAWHLSGDRDWAYDLAQESFARLWQKKGEWKPTGSVAVWLLRTTRNLVVSEQRRWNIRNRWTRLAGAEESRRPRTPLQEVEDGELRDAIQRAIQELSPRRREAFTLFHLQNLSYREIAEVMEVRPQTVANYLQAAVTDLRAALTPFFPSLADPNGSAAPRESEAAEWVWRGHAFTSSGWSRALGTVRHFTRFHPDHVRYR